MAVEPASGAAHRQAGHLVGAAAEGVFRPGVPGSDPALGVQQDKGLFAAAFRERAVRPLGGGGRGVRRRGCPFHGRLKEQMAGRRVIK